MSEPIIATESHRLLVLLPAALVSRADLAHRINWMALSERRELVYIILADQGKRRAPLCESMEETIASSISQHLPVKIIFTPTERWLAALRGIFRPGDRIACQSEQMVTTGFFRTLPLVSFLQEKVEAPIWILSGYYQPEKDQLLIWARSIIFWLVSLLIMAAFTIVEVRISPPVPTLHSQFFLCIMVLLELVSLWAWQSNFD